MKTTAVPWMFRAEVNCMCDNDTNQQGSKPGAGQTASQAASVTQNKSEIQHAIKQNLEETIYRLPFDLVRV